MTGETSGDEQEDLRQLVESQMNLGNASKRARGVARIILEQGSCTTSDIEALGYKHSPRAVGDLRDAGVNVIKVMERYLDPDTETNKRRARYSINGITKGKKSRHPFSKITSDAVKASGRCEVCGSAPPLQIDHRVPFEIGGETYPHVASDLMPLCPSCNRTKSWECEHCINRQLKDVEVCKGCMWASPTDYKHVATRQVREIRATLNNPEDIRRFDDQRPNVEDILSGYLESVENGDQSPLD